MYLKTSISKQSINGQNGKNSGRFAILHQLSESSCSEIISFFYLASYTLYVCNQNCELKEHVTMVYQIYPEKFETQRQHTFQQYRDEKASRAHVLFEILINW